MTYLGQAIYNAAAYVAKPLALVWPSYWRRQKGEQILDPVGGVFAWVLRNLECNKGAKPGIKDDKLDFYPAGAFQPQSRAINQVGSDDLIYCRRGLILFLKGWNAKSNPSLVKIVNVVIRGLKLQEKLYRDLGDIAADSCMGFAYSLEVWKLGRIELPPTEKELAYTRAIAILEIAKFSVQAEAKPEGAKAKAKPEDAPANLKPEDAQAIELLQLGLSMTKISLYPPDFGEGDAETIQMIKDKVWSEADFVSLANYVGNIPAEMDLEEKTVEMKDYLKSLEQNSETIKKFLDERHVKKYHPLVKAANNELKQST